MDADRHRGGERADPRRTAGHTGKTGIPGRWFVADPRRGAVGALDGPGKLGPEHAGALTLTFAAFADEDSAQRGYRHFTDMQRAMLGADGFLRRLTVVAQHDQPFEYSRFAGIWTAHTIGRRTLTCPLCEQHNVAPAAFCAACAEPLDDGFSG